MILKSNFKQLYVFDIIIPKANKAEEFAPLIEIAERELENFEEEENTGGITEDEFKQFVQDVYQQTLIDIVNEGNSSDEDVGNESLKDSHRDGSTNTNKINNNNNAASLYYSETSTQ